MKADRSGNTLEPDLGIIINGLGDRLSPTVQNCKTAKKV